jgi:integrase
MLWEYLPLERNPMELIKVKGSTKRQKPIVIITPEQFRQMVNALPEPYSLMALVCGCLGLRVSETLALKWGDFNWETGSVGIHQVFTHGQIQNLAKSDSSGNDLPVFPKLVEVLQEWQGRQPHEFDYVFANPKTGSPYSDSTILTRYLKPAAKKIGIEGLGWHMFRHSYKTWMASAKINPALMKDLMRHSDISTTMDVYGKTLTPELRAANTLVASQLFTSVHVSKFRT